MKNIILALALASNYSFASIASPLDRGFIGSYFGLDLARKAIPGMIYNNKFGNNPAVTAEEDVWAVGGAWTAPTSAGTVNIASTSVNDTATGAGARTITITGLNQNYDEVSETVVMNGQTNVGSVNSYWIIHRMLVNQSGSGATNAGTISAVSTGGGTPTLGNIPIGKGQTTIGVYQVPANYTAYIDTIQACFQNSTNDTTTDVEFFVKPFGGTYNLKAQINLMKTGTSCYTKVFTAPLKYDQKSIMKFTATPSGGSSDVSVDWDIMLVAD